MVVPWSFCVNTLSTGRVWTGLECWERYVPTASTRPAARAKAQFLIPYVKASSSVSDKENVFTISWYRLTQFNIRNLSQDVICEIKRHPYLAHRLGCKVLASHFYSGFTFPDLCWVKVFDWIARKLNIFAPQSQKCQNKVRLPRSLDPLRSPSYAALPTRPYKQLLLLFIDHPPRFWNFRGWLYIMWTLHSVLYSISLISRSM